MELSGLEPASADGTWGRLVKKAVERAAGDLTPTTKSVPCFGRVRPILGHAEAEDIADLDHQALLGESAQDYERLRPCERMPVLSGGPFTADGIEVVGRTNPVPPVREPALPR
jgi:hypothetical protein